MSPYDHSRQRPPKDDPFEVRRRRRFALPAWVEDNINIVTIILLFVVFGIPIKLILGLKACETGESSLPLETATISKAFGPLKVWGEGSNTHLKFIKVGIKNFGPGVAQGVGVLIHLYGAAWVLYGPSTIEVGKTAEYSAEVNWNVTSNDKIDVTFGCPNCVTPVTPVPE